jgi:2-polyprenyl-3-methyl-5-hydroxy-6-metoxy-1,4-benzoquinol methylase
VSKYYDHNRIWQKRHTDNNPVWGSYSVTLYTRILETLAAAGHRDGRLIDYGCGAGKFGDMAEQAGFSYIGLDDSGAAIELGKRTWPALQLLEFDLATRPLPAELTGCAPTATAINSLHCLTEASHRQMFIRNMAAGVAPGGILFLSTMVGPVTRTYRPSGNPRLYLDPDTVLAELAAAGFDRVISRSDLPPNDVNGIPNLEVVLEKHKESP